MPKVANGIDLVWRPWQVHAENWEYELRHGLVPKKAGVVRLLAFTNYANMGIYHDAVAQFKEGLVRVPDITHHPWHITRKYGFGANLEQNLTPNLTAFVRWGWDDGRTESFAYTEIDSTFAEGVRVNGAKWHRLRFERDQERSPELSGEWRERFPAWRWQAQLRAGEHRRIVLHGTRLARDLSRTRGTVRRQPWLQPRPGARSRALLPRARGVLGASVRPPACHAGGRGFESVAPAKS
jgi:hypothetical protein